MNFDSGLNASLDVAVTNHAAEMFIERFGSPSVLAAKEKIAGYFDDARLVEVNNTEKHGLTYTFVSLRNESCKFVVVLTGTTFIVRTVLFTVPPLSLWKRAGTVGNSWQEKRKISGKFKR